MREDLRQDYPDLPTLWIALRRLQISPSPWPICRIILARGPLAIPIFVLQAVLERQVAHVALGIIWDPMAVAAKKKRWGRGPQSVCVSAGKQRQPLAPP